VAMAFVRNAMHGWTRMRPAFGARRAGPRSYGSRIPTAISCRSPSIHRASSRAHR
jgi:hypothetical protein